MTLGYTPFVLLQTFTLHEFLYVNLTYMLHVLWSG